MATCGACCAGKHHTSDEMVLKGQSTGRGFEMNRRFFIVDVFAEEKYAGNQLAVIMDSDGLTTDCMLQITREMNYSESTFITSHSESGTKVRIFTPGEEVPFAGHPTLGTAYVVQQELIRQNVERVTLDLEVGKIPVTFSYCHGQPDELWMKQIQPVFGQEIEPADIAPVLGITRDLIDTRFPVEEVSTGLPFIIVPLIGLSAVKSCNVNTRALLEFVRPYDAKNILVFCAETYSARNNLNVRVFTDYLGIPEDPATGSANGCLAGYLIKHRYFGEPRLSAKVEQGYEINRPSLLLLRAEEKDGGIDINVGGRVQMVARGELV